MTSRSTFREPGRARAGTGARRWRALLVLLLIVLIAAAASGGYWYATEDRETTDDAYTDGRAVTLAPQVAGLVTALHVTDNQHVNAGEPLLEIDPRSFAAARDAAAASLQSAEAQRETARLNLSTARVNFPARLAMAQAALASARCGAVQGAG